MLSIRFNSKNKSDGLDRFVPSEVNTTWVVPHYLPPRQEVQVRAILHITHLVHYRYKHIPPAAGSLVHVTQIMIEPTQYRFYELRSLLGHVVWSIQNHMTLICPRRSQHCEQRILRVLQGEAKVISPVHHQHRYPQTRREIHLILSGGGRVEEKTTVQKNGCFEALLRKRYEDNSLRRPHTDAKIRQVGVVNVRTRRQII